MLRLLEPRSEKSRECLILLRASGYRGTLPQIALTRRSSFRGGEFESQQDLHRAGVVQDRINPPCAFLGVV